MIKRKTTSVTNENVVTIRRATYFIYNLSLSICRAHDKQNIDEYDANDEEVKLSRREFHKCGNELAEWTVLQGQRAPILVRGERGKMAGVAGMRPPKPCSRQWPRSVLVLLMMVGVCCCVVPDADRCRYMPAGAVCCYFFVFFFYDVSTSSGICIHACYTTGLQSVLPGIRPLVRSVRLLVLHLFLLSASSLCWTGSSLRELF